MNFAYNVTVHFIKEGFNITPGQICLALWVRVYEKGFLSRGF